MLKNHHTHTTFSDGKNSMEEMVQTAIRLGFSELGLSDHSYTAFDPSYCMAPETYADYKQEIKRMQDLYGDKIRLLTGIEQDFDTEVSADGFDYVIGSVHYLKCGETYVTVDWGGEEGTKILTDAADRYFGGDIYSLLEYYFERVSDVVKKTNADIIGHFDLIKKSNEILPFFDPQHPRYIAAWKKAADALIPAGKVFEINIAPLIRGFHSEPYPSKEIQDYIRSKGGTFIYSGDTHSTEQLELFAAYFEKK